MTGLYHSADLDGLMCGAVLKHRWGDQIRLVGFDYGDDINEMGTVPNETVYMCDVSFEMDRMYKFGKRRDFIWIDHHATAINDYVKKCKELGVNSLFDTHFRVGVSGCELTWEKLYGLDFPYPLLLAGKYDTWRKEAERGITWDHARWFNLGMQTKERFTIDYCLSLLKGEEASEKCLRIIEEGKIIDRHVRYRDERHTNRVAKVKEVFGNRVLVANSSKGGSPQFDGVWNEEEHDIMLCWYFDGKSMKCGVYSTKEDVNCGLFAARFGGGGHKGAGGMTISNDKFGEYFL